MRSVARFITRSVTRPALLALLALAVLPVLTPPASAQQIPSDWLRNAPTPAQAETIIQGAEKYGWPAMAAALREAALTLYGVNSGSGGGGMRLDLAEAWLYPALWAAQFAEKEDTFLSRWTKSVEDAGVAHSNMPSQYEAQPDALLGTRLPPPLQRQLLPDRGLSAVYFDQLSPCDYLPAVFDTLTALHAANPARFAKYAQLALALALVHDTPPPPDWPHGQVTPKALPRQLLPPATVFQYLTDTAEAGKSLQKLDQLTATELRFVVDIIAPETDLLWAQQNVKQPLSRLDATYGMVPYSTARLRAGVMVWPRPTYRLSELRGEGGICVDQAYFATQCGKARGVPTLLFRGAGMDGRHAWFGYLDGAKKWQLDAGRYEEQRYIAGFAHDPQTWADISDHELQFLSEGFRRLPTYRTSHVHALFAAALLDAGRLPAATRAARASVTAERRNVDGWELLLNLQKHESAADTKAREALLREAATALQRYPELNARYLREAVACVRARGDTAAADQEERMLARKFRSDRADLTIEQAGEMVKRAMAESSIAEAVRSYNLALTRFGKGQGIDFYDKVARPFVVYLATKGEKAEALKALARARNALNVQPGTQIDTEMTSLRMRLEALPAQAGKS